MTIVIRRGSARSQFVAFATVGEEEERCQIRTHTLHFSFKWQLHSLATIGIVREIGDHRNCSGDLGVVEREHVAIDSDRNASRVQRFRSLQHFQLARWLLDCILHRPECNESCTFCGKISNCSRALGP